MGFGLKGLFYSDGSYGHYRSANQQTAHYAKKSCELQRKKKAGEAGIGSATRRRKSCRCGLDRLRIFKVFGGKP